VLELVRSVQSGLGLYGMFDLSAEERNGLLCDITVEGIQKWITEVGEPLLELEVSFVNANHYILNVLIVSVSQWNA
jgi:hypothetical protein